MSLITTLLSIFSSAHAVAVTSLNDIEVAALVTEGFVQRGVRSCQGKVFTTQDHRDLIKDLFRTPSMYQSSGLKVLAAIKNAPHAVSAAEVRSALAVTSEMATKNSITLLVNAKLVREHRRKAGKFFTNPSKADFIAKLLSNENASPIPAAATDSPFTPGEIRALRALIQTPAATTGLGNHTDHDTGSTPVVAPPSTNELDLAILRAIKSAPHAITAAEAASAVSCTMSQAGVALARLGSLGLVKAHSRKAGYWFTNPSNAGGVNAALAAAAPAPGVPVPTDAVLAMLRLSKHGVSMNGIWTALSKLISEGIVRADKRDNDANSKAVRYFVRKGGPRQGDIRAKADARIAKIIATNDDLVDLVNGVVDAAL